MIRTSRRPMIELTLIAQAEMINNPTITTYTFENGVEHRQPANALLALDGSLQRLTRVVRQIIGSDQ